MDLKLRGKVAVVTGSSRGIGLAISRALAEAGTNVVMVARTYEPLQLSANKIRDEFNVDTVAFPADVSDQDSAGEIINATISHFGHLDILVCNAGDLQKGSIEDLDEEIWQSNFDLNLMQLVRLARLAVPHLKEQQWGRIVALVSLSVRQPSPGQVVSNASRTAVVAVAKTLAMELAPYNITVNCVSPGRILTPRIESRMTPEEINRFSHEHIPAKRFGRPEELAELVVFLASPLAGYITGNTIMVDGGMCRTLT